MKTATIGQVVKFAAPEDEYEAAERFVVCEDRGDRALVQCIGGFDDWSIKPQAVYPLSDLCKAERVRRIRL